MENKKNILLMATGSVAAIKLPNLIRLLQSDPTTKFIIKVALTQNATHFLSMSEMKNLLPDYNRLPGCPRSVEDPSIDTTPATSSDDSICYKSPFDQINHKTKIEKFTEILTRKSILLDADEWSNWSDMGDPVAHILLRQWADIGVIAPLDANTLGKISSGMCDNLVTCILRAWDVNKPLIYAPAMNVNMWTHPITERCLKVPQELGYIRVGPITKKLACGDIGEGAMAEVQDIYNEIIRIVRRSRIEHPWPASKD